MTKPPKTEVNPPTLEPAAPFPSTLEPEAPGPIPMLDPSRMAPKLADALVEAAARVIQSGLYVLGPEVGAFEQEVGDYLDVKHAIGVSSGTDALIVALMALGVGPGDEVIVPAFSFVATAAAVKRVGALPVFADVSLVDFCSDLDAIAPKVTRRTRAIIVAHLFGQCAPMGPIQAFAADRRIPVIEDAAQALGADAEAGQIAGTIGTIGCFSFYPTKVLGACGDAGLVVTDDAQIATRVRSIRSHGASPVSRYQHPILGGNFRIDELQAALLRAKLPRLDSWIDRREELAATYSQRLAAASVDGVPLAVPNNGVEGDARRDAAILYPVERCHGRHVWAQYTIRVQHGRRDDLRAFLSEREIATEVYYPIPLHRQKSLEGPTPTNMLGQTMPRERFPNADRLAAEVLSLPLFPELRSDEVERVTDAIVEFCLGVRS